MSCRSFLGIFHHVGNGLAYTGEWDSKNFFAYDVGSQNKQLGTTFVEYLSWLKQCHFNPLLLVISHFHADHIRHLSEFLDMFRPKAIILPYFFPKEGLTRTFAIASFASRGLSRFVVPKDVFYFGLDPIGYITDRVPDAKIYVLEGGEPHPFEIESLRDRDFPDDREIIYHGEEQRLAGSDNVVTVDGRGYWTSPCSSKSGIEKRSIFWFFRAYNPLPQKRARQKLEEFRERIQEILGKNPEEISVDELYTVLKNKKNAIYNAYRDVFRDLNIASIQLWHGPCKLPLRELLWYFRGMTLSSCPPIPHRYYNCSCCLLLLRGGILPGTYLSGDLPLNESIVRDISVHFRHLLDWVGVAQIPHHGSKHTFNKAYLNLFQGANPIFVLSGLKSVPKALKKYCWTRYLSYFLRF